MTELVRQLADAFRSLAEAFDIAMLKAFEALARGVRRLGPRRRRYPPWIVASGPRGASSNHWPGHLTDWRPENLSPEAPPSGPLHELDLAVEEVCAEGGDPLGSRLANGGYLDPVTNAQLLMKMKKQLITELKTSKKAIHPKMDHMMFPQSGDPVHIDGTSARVTNVEWRTAMPGGFEGAEITLDPGRGSS